MNHVRIKELPEPVQAALQAVKYNRVDIEVRPSATVGLSSGGADGCRSFVTLVNLSTGQHGTTWGSWGGPNMFNPSNPVDMDRGSYALPADGVAITGSIGGNRPVYAILHIPASMVDRILPAATPELTTEQRDALHCHVNVKGGTYRREEMTRRHVTATTMDDMVSRGWIKRNKAGATSVTTEGRNALGDYRGY